MAEKSVERKSFDLRIAALRPAIRDKYQDLLTKKQIEGAKGNNGKPVTITVEDRELLLKRAERIVFYGNVDPDKMQEDWERAASNGRPPIGGAVDD